MPIVQNLDIEGGQTLLKVYTMTLKKPFCSLWMVISFNLYSQKSQTFHHSLWYKYITKSYYNTFLKQYILPFCVECGENGSLEVFLVWKCLRPLRVKWTYMHLNFIIKSILLNSELGSYIYIHISISLFQFQFSGSNFFFY